MARSIAVALALALPLATFPAAAESPDDILIIANPSLSAVSISKAEAREIFLRTKTDFRGSRTTPIHASDGSVLRKTFSRKVLGMTEAEEKQYWEKVKIMEGKMPPASFSNTSKAVFKLKDSISYVFRKDYKNVGKILLVIPG